jgi:4-hydroxybenzoate polyprenyltransferase
MNYKSLSADTAGYFLTNRIHVFLMPALLTLFWNLDAGLALPFEFYLMISCTTAGGYIYNMYTDEVEDAINYTARYRLFGRHGTATKAAVFGFFFMGFLLSLPAGWRFVLYGGVVNFLGSLYSRPLRFGVRKQTFRIKEIPVLKNLYAGVFWSVGLVLTPYIYVGQQPGPLALLTMLISFGLSYFVELMWDLRDMRGDRRAGVRTVPLLIGEPATCWILRTVHVAACLMMLWGARSGLLLETKTLVTFALYLPLGLIFLEWYRKLPDKTWASHMYILCAGVVILIGMVSQAMSTKGV